MVAVVCVWVPFSLPPDLLLRSASPKKRIPAKDGWPFPRVSWLFPRKVTHSELFHAAKVRCVRLRWRGLARGKAMFIALGVADLLRVVPAGAQVSRMQMEIPFAFVADEQALPAGPYYTPRLR